MPSYKLRYFDARGVIECSRCMFAIAGVPYEDARFGFSFGTPGDFSTIQRPEFDAAKASGELDAALGKVPVLEVDGMKLGQSKAIERYLARELGFMGATPMEAAQIDQHLENIVDFKAAYQKAKGTQGEEEKKAALEKWFAEDMPNNLKLVEKSLPDAGGPWLVGSKLSLADLSYYLFLLSPKGYFDNTEGARAAFQDCPRLKSALEAVDAVPELQAWIKSRPETMF
eukprot:TRINITY_DN15847_c0_g1_i1.p1 TRINITY_DN15847_c0_g1~~TRINITY_DN15847_c0_g1_i1.p1  ORF type:complete len:250 (+),score=53.32 TRINITY_DN15847_c0_g1_i1:71-751(+)